eukprot:m.97665 g.97665  ORF g.97665 m.97665 type:complete len:195 (+) comp13608_c0_seq3:57-641(+)
MADEEFGDDFGGFGDFDDDGFGDTGGNDEEFGDSEGFGGFSELPEDEGKIEHEDEPPAEEEKAPTPKAQRRSSDAVQVTGEKSGWMKVITGGKKKGFRNNWKERWFNLKDGKLEMKDTPASEKREALDLTLIKKVEKDTAPGSCRFSIITARRSFYFQTRSERDCQMWVDNLEHAKASFFKANFSAKQNAHMLF